MLHTDLFRPDNLKDASKPAFQIERGNTCAGVNAAILEYLVNNLPGSGQLRFLDVPCGDGSFLLSAKRLFPLSEVVGADIEPQTNKPGKPDKFCKFDAACQRLPENIGKFDVITSISGIMEFGNTQFFLSNLCDLLKDSGILIISNDNLLSVRDRLLYLLFGRTGQYPGIASRNNPTWKPIPIAALLRLAIEAGLEPVNLFFVLPGRSEFLWSPLAIPVYCIQMIYDKLSGFDARNEFGFRLHPLISLYSRHYFITCRKRTLTEIGENRSGSNAK